MFRYIVILCVINYIKLRFYNKPRFNNYLWGRHKFYAARTSKLE